MLLTILLWAAGIYFAIGLLSAAVLAVIAQGQGDPLSLLKFAGFVVKWPAVLWDLFGP